jgi:hypothetical protein
LSTVAISPKRVREDLIGLVHRGADVREFAFGATRILARAMATMDPATLMPTGTVAAENVPPPATHPRLKEIEFRGEDFNALPSLALSERRAASRSEATGGTRPTQRSWKR